MKKTLAIGAFTLAVSGCLLTSTNILTSLNSQNAKLVCHINEPFLSYAFNNSGDGKIELRSPGNTPPDYPMETATHNLVSSNVDSSGTITNFLLSNGAQGTLQYTPQACENDMSGDISDYTVVFSNFGSNGIMQSIPLELNRGGCCSKSAL